jgi:hypothetical protein
MDPKQEAPMLERFVLVAFLALAPVRALAGDPEPLASPPPPARISFAWTQGFTFLDGGYADAGTYYSTYWDTGQSFGAHVALDLFPVLRTGIEVCVREFEDQGFGIDDLHVGHARIDGALRLPLALPSKLLLDPQALPALRGAVAYFELGLGLGVIDPTSDAFGGFYDRTYTFSLAACVGVEYKRAEWGLFIEFGIDLLGAPNRSANFKADPDPILSFPLTIGLRLYLP